MHGPRLSRPPLTDAEQRRYQALRAEHVTPFERLAAVTGALSIVAFILWDREVDPSALGDTVAIRLTLAVVLLAFLAITFTRLGRFHTPLQIASTGVIIGGFSWVLTELPDGFAIGLAGLTLSTALLPLLAVTLRSLVVLCAVSVGLPNLFLVGQDATRLTFVNLNTWMALAVALAVSFWWVYDTINRRLFIAEEGVIEERERADRLLENMLPEGVAARLKVANTTVADRFEVVTVLFADIVGFTAFAQVHEPDEIVRLLNELFSDFDDLVSHAGLEKIKTLGDGYMVAGGVPIARPDHPRAVADLALTMLGTTKRFAASQGIDWSIRIGIHSGSVVAGVIGKHKLAYDLWGDAVNVASRLESTGVAGRIQVSGPFARLLPDAYEIERRGTISLKNRGSATTYFLVGRTPSEGQHAGAPNRHAREQAAVVSPPDSQPAPTG